MRGDGSGQTQLDRSSETPAFDGRKRRILVVDDDEDVRILARKAFSSGRNVMLEASGGAEAMQLIQSEKPDLVVLDLLMPSPDGREVLRWMRDNDRAREIPVLVLTAQGDEDSIRTCFDLGATDYLVKPFTAPQLDVRVRYGLARAKP